MKARRVRRLVAATATGAVLTAALSGCVTVNGEAAVVPAVSKGEAQKALDEFTELNNKANKTFDAEVNSSIETGVLGTIDQAGLKASKKLQPGGNSGYTPLELSDTRFLIPKQAGWPKFFVSDSKSNRQSEDRWVFVFQRNNSKEKWKASYVSEVPPEQMPDFATDKDGFAEPVPRGKSGGLAVAPGELSKSYVRYLNTGEGEFAPGPETSQWRERREAMKSKPGVSTQFADLATEPPQYTPFGLRTKDGGAMVFFATQHHTKQTVASGYTPKVGEVVEAMMKGEPRQSVRTIRFSQQSVTVPAKSGSGQITFLDRIDGLTGAKGE